MGRGYDAICNRCGARFQANEGPDMSFLLYHCTQCGKEQARDFDLGPEGIRESGTYPDHCECGGSYTEDAPPRCPRCHSVHYRKDPDGVEVMYD
jgi:hypothetical protein